MRTGLVIGGIVLRLVFSSSPFNAFISACGPYEHYARGFVMRPGQLVFREDEQCPISDEMLAEMYRASAHGLIELISTISSKERVLLAVYCYRRAHLASIGLTIAATCEKIDLTEFGGNAGAVLFERSREISQLSSTNDCATSRPKITLSTKPLRSFSPIE